MSVDFLKLFQDKRLTIKEPEHLAFIKGRLAALKFEDPSSYEMFSAHYGVTVEAEAKVEPVKIKNGVVQVKKPAKKKAGRPAKK